MRLTKKQLSKELHYVRTSLKKAREDIDLLRAELTDDMMLARVFDYERGQYVNQEELTVTGKVNAIIDHLKLDVSVLPKECTPAKITVSVKKRKKARKK